MLRGRLALLTSVLGLTLIGQAIFGQAAPAAAPTTPATPPAVWATPGKFNVNQFGVIADGKTLDTKAFQKALDTCAVNGGGEVLVPAGNYMIGSIQIGANTTLKIDEGATVTGTPDLEQYPTTDVRWEGRWEQGLRGLIFAKSVSHIAITGLGKIVGGRWGTNGAGGVRNPVVIECDSCTDVRWEDVSVDQGGHWATHPVYCTDLNIKNIKITGGRDGIDVDSCKGVHIDGCTLNMGDDCISLKSGRGMDGARLARPCEDITITNCDLTDRTFACLGIGSETSGGIKNVHMEHCKLNAVRSAAIYIKTRIGRGWGIENVSVDDCDINAQIAIRVNMTAGGNASTADDTVEGLVGYPFGRNFSFTNIRATVTGQLMQGTQVSAFKPVEGLTLTNITGTAAKGITLANIKGANLKDIKITGFTGALIGDVNTTGTGLEGAEAIDPPVDPPPGNARGGFGGGRGGAGGGRGGAGGGAGGGRGGRGRGGPGGGPAPASTVP